jgi:hypothetical protein
MPRLLTSFCVCLLLATNVGAQGVQVQWADDRLSVRADGVPLRDVVEAVAGRVGMTVTGTERLSGRLSLEFHDKHVVDGMSLLLERVNYVLTQRAGAIHVMVHSMADNAEPVRAATAGPIFIRGLSDRIPHENPTDPTDPNSGEPDEEEKQELSDLEGAIQVDDVGALIDALDSDYSSVRMRAVRSLGGRDPADITEPLTDMLTDDEVDIAITAADLLAAVPGEEALEALAQHLPEDQGPDAQLAALRGLARRADPASIPHIRRFMKEIDPSLQEFASQLLRELEARERAASPASRAR